MSSQGNGQGYYQVVLVGTVNSDLKHFHEELTDKGQGTIFLEILHKVNDRLRTDPRSFGEMLYRLPALKLSVYQGIILPLVVTYGVYDELPLVFVRVVKLLANQEN